MVPVQQLAEIPFFRGLPAPVLEELSSVTEERRYVPNELIAHQHDEARWFYLLLEGTVQFLIRVEGVHDLLVGTTRTRGEPIGWSVLRPPYRYTASVRCEGRCRVLRVPRTVFQKLTAADAEVGYELLERLAEAVARRLAETKAQLIAAPEDSEAQPSPPLLHEPAAELDMDSPSALTVLEHSPFFETLDQQHLQQLADHASWQTYRAGETLFEEGAPADQLHVLLAGSVELSFLPSPKAEFSRRHPDSALSRRVHLRSVLDPGQVLGSSAMVRPHRYRASAIASERTRTLVFDREFLERMCRDDPAFGMGLMRQILLVLGNRLRATRVRLVARRYDQASVAVRALLDQGAELLHVTSPLHKVPFYLENRLTVADAFHSLELLKTHGDENEKNLAGLCLEILQKVRLEMRIYQHLQKIYEHVANAPESASQREIRRRCCEEFCELFAQVSTVVRGTEHLPEHPGHIVVMNHLCNHPDNTLPNEFQLTLDTHFVSALILYEKYGEPPVRVIRRSAADEFGHQQYYDRLGYIYVRAATLDESSDESRAPMRVHRRRFLHTAAQYLQRGTNIVICPEGTSVETERSPVAFKKGAFHLAAHVHPEPFIVPVAVANFDKKITQTTVAAVVHPPFRLSERVSDPSNRRRLHNFVASFEREFATWVKEAIRLANEQSRAP